MTNKLIDDNIGFIIDTVQSFRPNNNNELDQYIQLGRVAFWHASQNHDPYRGKLTTLASRYIKNEILSYIREEKNRLSTIDINKINIPIISSEKLWEILPSNISQIDKLILQFRLEGYTFQEIGNKINMSPNYVSKIYKKLIIRLKKINV